MSSRIQNGHTSRAPELEILMPVFGELHDIRTAVSSVLAQDDSGWQLTVVDDASPGPGIESWLKSIPDPRLRYTRNPENLGLNRNFQRCLDLARHSHIVVMGQDDMMMPDYVRVVRSALAAHPEVAVVQPAVSVIDTNENLVSPLPDRVKALLRPTSKQPRVVGGEYLATILMHGNFTYFPSLCWNRDLMRTVDFRQGLDVTLDLRLLMDIILRGEQLLLLPDVVFRYRRHTDSASTQAALSGRRFEEEHRLYEELAGEFRARGWLRAARAARMHLSSRLHAFAEAPLAVRSGNLRVAARLLQHAVS